jgi:hypothetical protein
LLPALPIVVLFAMYGAVTAVALIAERSARGSRGIRSAFVIGIVTAFGLVAVGPAMELVGLERTEAGASTRVEAATWMTRHLSRGSKIAVEVKGPDLAGTGFDYVNHYALPLAGTIADYARAGYRYLVVNVEIVHRYRTQARDGKDFDDVAFYDYLRDDAKFVRGFHRDQAHGGPHLKIYELDPVDSRVERDASSDSRAEAVTLRTTAESHVERGSGPVPFARRALRRLARQPAVLASNPREAGTVPRRSSP